MKEYEVEIKFVDGTKVIVEVEAENEEEAYNLAMPINLRIIG